MTQKSVLSSGWILATGLLLLCITGSGLTWWNYSAQVFSSAHGVVVNAGSESRVVVTLPADEARVVRPGHRAIITVGEDKNPLKGCVLSVTPESTGVGDAVLIRVLNAPSQLPTGAQCGVTIDTTVPPMPMEKNHS